MTIADDLGITWEDPSDSNNHARGSRVDKVIDVLKQNPGEWALVATYAANGTAGPVAHQYKRSGCEATTRGGKVYARWPQ